MMTLFTLMVGTTKLSRGSLVELVELRTSVKLNICYASFDILCHLNKESYSPLDYLLRSV